MKDYDIDLEKVILQKMINYPDHLSYGLQMITPEDFYDDTCKYVLKILKGLVDKNKAVNFEEVMGVMKDQKEVYLISFLQNVYDSLHAFESNFKGNITRLRNLSSLRAYNVEARKGFDIIAEGTNPEEIEQRLFSGMMKFMGRRDHADYKSVSDAIVPMLSGIEDRMAGKTGIQTGINSLDQIIIGMEPGKLIIIAARPSMGKSALAAGIARNIAKKNIPCGIFSFEMKNTSILERYIADESDVSYYKIRTGKLSEAEMERIMKASNTISKHPIYIDDRGGDSVNNLCQQIKLMKLRNKIQIAFIDHLSYVSENDVNRNQQIESILKKLKILGKELSIPIVLLSQLNRGREDNKDKIPLLSDLRDSGAIEQDADVVIMLYRDEYYNPETSKRDVLDIFIRKNRDGMTGQTSVLFLRDRMRFIDIPNHGEIE